MFFLSTLCILLREYFLFFIEKISSEIFQIAVGIAMGGIAITIVGFIDDVVETRALTKLFIQIILYIIKIHKNLLINI